MNPELKASRGILLSLANEFSRMCLDSEVKAILMHGALLGWFWSGKPLPWNEGLDFCVREEDLRKLEMVPQLGYDQRTCCFVVIGTEARFIHRTSGIFLKIGVLWREGPALVSVRGHRYLPKELFPPLPRKLCGALIYVPANAAAVLKREYGAAAITSPFFEGWHFDGLKGDWRKSKFENADRGAGLWKHRASNRLLHVREDAVAFRRVRLPIGPKQQIYDEPMKAEIKALPEHRGDLRSWLKLCCDHCEEKWWIDLNPQVQWDQHGGDLFLDRSYEKADVVVCGSFLIQEEGKLVRVPKLEGPMTLWRGEFAAAFLKLWDLACVGTRPELLLREMMDQRQATVIEASAWRMGWRVR